MEVKGGRVSCEDGTWTTTDRRGNMATLKKSPFMQSRESMFALRHKVLDHFGQWSAESRCPIGCAVVFADVDCPPPTPEFERADVIDAKDLQRPISESIERTARTRLEELHHRNDRRFAEPSHLKAIQTYLRPDFDRVLAKSVSLGRSEARLVRLTEEQYDRLDELEDNPRCLFEGAAGTGKTLLALEYARRASRSGASVLFVCFNRLLGDWLREQTEGTSITAGTWHRTLRKIIESSSVGDEFLLQEYQAIDRDNLSSLFDDIYPLYGELALEEMQGSFDVLVMDEAQDLLDETTLSLLSKAIGGGLEQGTWAFFGDFTRQALYGDGSRTSTQVSLHSEHFVRARLTLNCRNTKRIAEETAIVGGFDAPPFRLGREQGMPVEHRYWKTADGMLKSIERTVDRLTRDGVRIDDMVILSPIRLEKSALASVGRICGMPLVDCSRSLHTPQE